MSLLTPKLPPYMRKKSPPGGFFGKAVPPNSPYHLTMSIPIFCTTSTSHTSSPANTRTLSSNGSPKSPICITLPRGLVPMEHQVAGHTFQDNNLGLLKRNDGTVLKPAGKAACGAREIKFYESLRQKEAPDYLCSLRDLVPKYSGSETVSIDSKDVTFIRLDDLTDKMLEPCVMDVKIGRRTWDPLATAEKRAAEESKYVACKQNLGFCVPGFQVHSVKTGRVKRFGKEYGKKLSEQTIKEAFRLFLNADTGLCRSLLMQFLSGLWAIQSWARTQTNMRVYSSSVLFVYDARRLREVLESNKRRPQSPQQSQSQTPSLNGNSGGNGFTLNRSVSSASSTSSHSSMGSLSPGGGGLNGVVAGGEPIQSFKKIQRLHSVNNNYDQVTRWWNAKNERLDSQSDLHLQDIKEMQVDYVLMLDNLRHQNEERRKEWATVKMIDFAHTFPSEDNAAVDENYLFGIENLVKIFEEFLQECDQ